MGAAEEQRRDERESETESEEPGGLARSLLVGDVPEADLGNLTGQEDPDEPPSPLREQSGESEATEREDDSSRFTFTSATAEPPVSGIGDRLFEGFLEKKGGGTRALIGRRNWSKRWFVLHHNVLTYYRDPADEEPAGQVELSGGRLETESSAKHDYHLTIRPEHRKAFEVRVPSGSGDAAGTYAVFLEALRGTALTSNSAEAAQAIMEKHWDGL
jgi:hypothetical protein